MGTPELPERSDSFQPGQSIGKFYLVQLIGEGGTSRIFKALQQPISRVVALKIPSFPQTGGVLTPDEFLSEATLMARLDHPNIARIHDFGVEDGKAFISMEHVEGWNLQELVARHRPLSVSAVLAIGLQALEALMHAHSRDVLHQDLSPANVLVSRAGCAKLIDFGMAGKRTTPGSGNVVGTPAFLSPEHVAGKPSTARSDLFSFGSLLYFACRGELLFDPGEDAGRLRETLLAIEKARWQPPLDKLRALPAPLSRLVRSALEGGDPESLLRDMKELWSQAEGQTRPEDALRRELAESDDPGAGTAALTDQAIRETYLKLRSEGRHREAVALLERALRKQPDNPLLRDLLSTPPARAKSAPVTVEVAAPAGPGGGADRSRGNRRRAWILASGAAALAGLVAFGALRARQDIPAAGRPEDPVPAARAAAVPGAEAAASREDAPEGPSPGGNPSPDRPRIAAGDREAAIPDDGPDGPPRFTRVSSVAPSAIPAAGPAANPAGNRSVTGGAAKARRPRPPALSLSGPAGTRILVNDSLELDSPAPRGGWTLPAGLVNLVVTRPGNARPISSSLFASPDTLYVLDLEEGGGFTVSRKAR